MENLVGFLGHLLGKNNEENLDNWEESEIAKDHSSTIKITEKRLKEQGEHLELQQKLEELKIAVVKVDKKKAEKIDDEINDLIFDLG